VPGIVPGFAAVVLASAHRGYAGRARLKYGEHGTEIEDRMSIFDLVPIVPPGLPGERSPELTETQRFGAGFASTLLPTVNFLLVLFTGFAAHVMIALVLLPGASGGIVYAGMRRLATPRAWAIVLAMGCATFCFIGDGCALFLHLLARFFQDF
jgi:hypothetical protein